MQGEMYVTCQAGCLGLFDEGPGTPRPDSDLQKLLVNPDGTYGKEEGVPREGGAANGSETDGCDDLPF